MNDYISDDNSRREQVLESGVDQKLFTWFLIFINIKEFSFYSIISNIFVRYFYIGKKISKF